MAQSVVDLTKINNLNVNEKENSKNKKKKFEEDVTKNNDNMKKLNESKNEIKNVDKEKEKDKSKEKNKEKEKDIENKNNKENNEDENIDADKYLSNPTIKFIYESGFPLKDAIEAWSIFEDDKESAIEYLLNKKNYRI